MNRSTTRQPRFAQSIIAAGLALGALVLPTAAASAQTAPAVVEERLYGTSQWGTFPLQNAGGTATMAFDDATSSMTGQFAQESGSDWTYGTLQQTSLKSIQSAAIEVRFATAGWQDDAFVLEYTTDNWATVRQLAAYGAANPAPSALQTVTFANLQGVLNSPQAVNAVQVRFRTAPQAAAQPSGGSDRERADRERKERQDREERERTERREHRDNGKGNDDKARPDNRGGNAGNGAKADAKSGARADANAKVAPAAAPAPARATNIAAPAQFAPSTSTTVNAPETYTLSVDQVRLVVKGS